MIFLPESIFAEQPQSTTVKIPPTKTLEEMQEEAKDEGLLEVKHKLSWWYPWYRMPFVLDVVKGRRKMRLRRPSRREKWHGRGCSNR